LSSSLPKLTFEWLFELGDSASFAPPAQVRSNVAQGALRWRALAPMDVDQVLSDLARPPAGFAAARVYRGELLRVL